MMRTLLLALALLLPSGALAETLFTENFEDGNFASRGWYDGETGTIDTNVFAPAGGSTASLRVDWTQGGTSPTAPRRQLFTATEQVYGSFWIKFGSASVTWQGSGDPYHPHFIHLLTDENGEFDGLAWTHLTFYVETSVFTPRIVLQDSTRINAAQVGNNLLGTATSHAIAGCNGNQTQLDPDPALTDCFEINPDWFNSHFLDAPSAAFSNNTWHHVEFFVKMNTINGGVPQADGIIRYWVDGNAVIDHSNAYLRTAQYPDQRFNQFILAPYIGDGSPIAQSLWLDNLLIADAMPTSPGCGAGQTCLPFRISEAMQ